MSKFIKLIWDFRGSDAAMTSKHHIEHLNEFISKNKLAKSFAAGEEIDTNYSIAFIVVENEKMEFVRDRLKPHRGEMYKT